MEIKEFDTYLANKKIDSEAFKSAEAVQWHKWKQLYDQMHPNSFTAQKLNLINPLRRRFPLKEQSSDTEVKKTVPRPKVMMRPKPKTD